MSEQLRVPLALSLGQGPLELMEHQVEGIRWMIDRPRSLLADEPGLGKSVQALRAAVEPVLVVAPAMVLDSGTWDDEIERWAPGMDVTQVPYSGMRPKGQGSAKIPRDSNGFPKVELAPELKREWGTVIADEAHYVKGRKTWWTSTVQQLRTDRMHLLTGTPIPNWAHEAFTLLQLIYPEKARSGQEFGSYWRWVKKWFEVDESYFNPKARVVGDLLDRHTWLQFREANWGDRFLMRLREECLDLPPLTIQEFRVKMTAPQRKAYRDLKRDFITWLESGEEVAAWSSAGLMVKLAQCATGLEVLDPTARGSGKLDALRTLLTDRPRPTLVVAHFRKSVEACAKVAYDLGRKVLFVHGGVSDDRRKTAIRAFQRGELDVMCASIDTISEGMTLHQGGADQVIRAERSWRPSKNEQVIRRLHRIGVEVPISVIDLITEDTLDEKVLRVLAEKDDHQMKALGLRELAELI